MKFYVETYHGKNADDFKPIITKSLELYFVFGGVGAGKTTIMENNFDNSFIKAFEPIEEMKPILRKFYSGEIDGNESTKQISKLNMRIFREKIDQALRENKHLVVESIPWLKPWIFKYPSDMTTIKHFELMKKYIKEDILLDNNIKEELIELNEYEKAMFSCASIDRRFKKVTFVYIEQKTEIIGKRIKQRDRDCENDINIGYLDFIQKRNGVLCDHLNKKLNNKRMDCCFRFHEL
jgi:deoxyadenosine/deoxycytidine kinase